MTPIRARMGDGSSGGNSFQRGTKFSYLKRDVFFFVDPTRFSDDLEIRWRFFLAFVWEK